ncbi:MAG: tRNA (N6-isopentenyl adenosine(37)-C2)-methylthiotransferase MiaB [Deltaproteobacteria bacterium]|nr:tRNA (N6-isopentenyl adenosine(37)-C2)-methylthiotransferase MiaB [Deltaproteobacteria bacterium]
MRFFIRTYGCQMNEHDSRKIAALLSACGDEAVPRAADADCILFNTCTIRDKARQKALSEIGRTARLKAARPDLVVGVCGCVAQQEQEVLFERFPHIDLLFGPDQIAALPRLLAAVREEHRQVAAVDLVNTPEAYRFLDLAPWGQAARASAFVTIMKGCDSRCAYCIVPKVRGAEVSRPADEIIAEVRALAASGTREAVLLGQTVNAYGKGGRPGTVPFAMLLKRIADETAIDRIRFTSPHPKDVDAALVEAYRTNAKLCRHIHLPLQSGADVVLRRMRRAYSLRQYREKVTCLRDACPDLAISTDIIVGFPGETDADFQATMAMLRDVGFDGLYAFRYSPRPGTESFARMPDDVPDAVKAARLHELLAAHSAMNRRKLATLVGTTAEVLVEGPSPRAAGAGWLTGRTTHHRIVHFPGDSAAVGNLRTVRITAAQSHSLTGECIDLGRSA